MEAREARVLQYQDPDTHRIYYYVKIDDETYSTLFNQMEQRTQNGNVSYNNYAISGVVVHEGEYFMTISDPSPGKEDQLKTFKLLGDDLEGFRQKVNNYNINGHSFFADESKGHLRF